VQEKAKKDQALSDFQRWVDRLRAEESDSASLKDSYDKQVEDLKKPKDQ
jgi:hypothetical protein